MGQVVLSTLRPVNHINRRLPGTSPITIRGPRADARKQAGGQACTEDDPPGEGKEGKSRLENRIPQGLLEEVSEEQEGPQPRHCHSQRGQVRPAPVAIEDDAHWQQRVSRAQLDDDRRSRGRGGPANTRG